jgi:hypothetical protein
MVIKFITKCCLFSNSISFILPKSLKKYFEKHYHLIYEIDLLESNVPCIFQIWQYKNKIREKIDKKLPLNFKFVTNEDKPDISFSRVGIKIEQSV